MKKNIAFAFLVFGGILALSSCKDDDMEVYVGEDLRDKEIIEDVLNKSGYINIMKNNQNAQLYPENSYVDTHYITIISDKHNFKDSNGVVRTEQGDYAFSEGTILKVKEKC